MPLSRDNAPLTNTASSIVNLTRYPINHLASEGTAFSRQCRQQYLDNGLCILPEFILPDGITTLAEEANRASSQAWFCDSRHLGT